MNTRQRERYAKLRIMMKRGGTVQERKTAWAKVQAMRKKLGPAFNCPREVSATQRLRRAGLLVMVLMGVTSCAPSNLADVVRAGGENNATVCARVTTVYGTLTYMRSNVEIGGDVSCDTLTIKTTYPPPAPTNAAIPMTITPTFTITPNK